MAKKAINAKLGGKDPGKLARQLLSMPTERDEIHARGERGANGLIQPKDESRERVVVPGAGSMTLGKPLPTRAELLAQIKGLGAKQAVAVLMQSDIENGDFIAIWEKYKAMAKGGDYRAIESYFDRFIGKATQPLSMSAEVRVSMSEEDRAAINGLKGLFGMAASGAPVVAEAEAKEVA